MKNIAVILTTLMMSHFCCFTLTGEEVIPTKTLYKHFKPAVVKILTYQHGINVYNGAGFFVSPDGILVTNEHILKNVIYDVGYSAVFELSDGRKISKFEVASCGANELDLCIVKLDVKPDSFFPVNPLTASVGEPVYVIGHPHGLDYTFTNGLLSQIRSKGKHIKEVQISAPISPGNSGGPIFSESGKLIGVSTYIVTAAFSQNLNFGISVDEIWKIMKSKSFSFLQHDKWKAKYRLKKRLYFQQLKEKYFTPVWKHLKAKKDIINYPGWSENLHFYYKNVKLWSPLLKYFPYWKTYNKDNSFVIEIFNEARSAKLYVNIVKVSDPKWLETCSKNKTCFGPPKPLPVVKDLMAQGKWEARKKQLTAKQIEYLFSIQDPMKCKISKTRAFKGKLECNFNIFNWASPNGALSGYLIQDGDYVIEISTWVRDASSAVFYYNFPSILTVTLRPGVPPEKIKSSKPSR